MPIRLATTIAIAAVFACGLAGSASASTVAVENGLLVYTAEAGEVNETDIWRAYGPQYATEVPDSVYVYTVDDITPGPGCALAADASFPPFVGVAYLCSGVTAGAKVDLGDMNDWVTVETPGQTPVVVDAGAGNDFVGIYDSDDIVTGGPGDDQIYGGWGNDRLDGGEGNDEINGDYGSYVQGDDVSEDLEGAGSDTLLGGPGNDRLQGNGGADVLEGGAGEDLVLYNARKTAVSVSIDGQANDGANGENDAVGGDVEAVSTGLGDDVVRGGPGAETFNTSKGKDTVDPGGGADIVDTGADVDTIAARDGAVDMLGCGDGADSVTADAADVAGNDCEVLDRPAAPGPPAAGAVVSPARLALRAIAPPRSGRRLRLGGQLQLPAGADPRICSGVAVRISLTVTTRGRRKRSAAVAVLGLDCRFSTVVPVKPRRGARIEARATVRGTSLVAASKSRPLKLRVKR